MSKLGHSLARAAAELGLRIEVNKPVRLPSGEGFTADAFFPDLSTPTGVFVFDSRRGIANMEKLHDADVPASFFSEPGEREVYNVQDYMEMFNEWGWTGPVADRPSWMEKPEE